MVSRIRSTITSGAVRFLPGDATYEYLTDWNVELTEWTRIGEISLLQIQTGQMTGRGDYDTRMLVPVDKLRLTTEGVFGLSGDEWIADRHHRDHPAAKHWHAEDVLSFGFTSHYDLMWEMFRKTSLGIAGENVIVIADRVITHEETAGGLRIEANSGEIELEKPQIIEPCVEFTRFMTSRPEASAREVKHDREMLRNGVRGYVVGVAVPDAIDISLGDTVSIRTA
jgi:hypothetical protein